MQSKDCLGHCDIEPYSPARSHLTHAWQSDIQDPNSKVNEKCFWKHDCSPCIEGDPIPCPDRFSDNTETIFSFHMYRTQDRFKDGVRHKIFSTIVPTMGSFEKTVVCWSWDPLV